MDVSTSFEGSLLCVGGMQIYNKDYWKLPIVYGGLAAGIAGKIHYDNVGNTSAASLCYAGAGLLYWATLMDGVIHYEPGIGLIRRKPHSTRFFYPDLARYITANYGNSPSIGESWAEV